MNYKEDIVRYRLERAEETYQEALLMQREKHWNTCANRLYYACFYAVSALLQQHDFSSGKHSGVKAFFNRYFIKTGVLDKEFGRLYSRLFDARQEGDYIDFVRYAAEDVEPWIEKVRLFIDMVTEVICKK
ncbi:MAG: HEPN domain-containing protein [Candidatus Electrothrix sp. ATG1]|nr:HEPN domain-containing protein [Candidatus Electrothrix sp. ATG1]MCI5209965.1 HEPN domain-containing protein [Candidatus Electrothrix sp. ATG2]